MLLSENAVLYANYADQTKHAGIGFLFGTPSDSLTGLIKVHKSGNSVTGLNGYIDRVLSHDQGVTVWTKDCLDTATADKKYSVPF